MKVKKLKQDEIDILIKDAVNYYLDNQVETNGYSLNYDHHSFHFLYKDTGNTLLVRIGPARSSSAEPVLVTHTHGEIPSNIHKLIHPNIMEAIYGNI